MVLAASGSAAAAAAHSAQKRQQNQEETEKEERERNRQDKGTLAGARPIDSKGGPKATRMQSSLLHHLTSQDYGNK